MTRLLSLVYVSTATHEPSLSEIEHLLSRAKNRNAEQQVTGALLYDRSTFMQYIEGPLIGMGIVYDAIRRDPLHTGIIELLCEPISNRQFTDWAMGFRSSALSSFSEDWLHDDVLENHLAMLDLPAAKLLRNFWGRNSFPKY